jgi:dehydrodolichyl diphosphate syntase complex subunit NUS1
MDLVPALILRVLHFLYALTSLVRSFWRRQTRPCPRSLRFPRQKLPENLAVIFVIDSNIPPDTIRKTLFESLSNLVEWCRIVGIPRLIIYEEHGSYLIFPQLLDLTSALGYILQLKREIRETILEQEIEYHSSDSEVDYRPPTPPASVYSKSRQASPCHNTGDVTNLQYQENKHSEHSTSSNCWYSSFMFLC